MNAYELSRNFWNWSFDNPEKVSVNHSAIYFFAIEHCNRLGWKEKFGFPSQMTMDAIGIKKHSTYIRYFNDLVEFGFFELVQKSKNQYSSNIIRLTNALPKKDEALDKAFVKHGAKQTESMGSGMGQSKRSIDKQINKETIEPINQEQTNNACEPELNFEKDLEVAKEIAQKFSIAEVQQHQIFKTIVAFVNKNRAHGKLSEYFTDQLIYYHKYKEVAEEKKHGIKKYLGEFPEYNGAWNECDWKKKHQELIKSNGSNKQNSKTSFNEQAVRAISKGSYGTF